MSLLQIRPVLSDRLLVFQEDLARVEDVVRVESALDGFHISHRGDIEFHRDVGRLAGADAVFAAHGSAQ